MTGLKRKGWFILENDGRWSWSDDVRTVNEALNRLQEVVPTCDSRVAELEQALAKISNRMIRPHSRAEIQDIVRGVLPLPARGDRP